MVWASKIDLMHVLSDPNASLLYLVSGCISYLSCTSLLLTLWPNECLTSTSQTYAKCFILKTYLRAHETLPTRFWGWIMIFYALKYMCFQNLMWHVHMTNINYIYAVKGRNMVKIGSNNCFKNVPISFQCCSADSTHAKLWFMFITK